MEDKLKSQRAIAAAQEIISSIQALMGSEKDESEPTSNEDASVLMEAIQAIEKFIAIESGEEGSVDNTEDRMSDEFVDKVIARSRQPVVDTGTLTGPIGGLKSFLIRKQRDNEAK